MYILTGIIFFSCRENERAATVHSSSVTVIAGDTALHLLNGVWYYKKEDPFTGIIKEVYPDGKIKTLQPIQSGMQQGFTETYYTNGSTESKRWYTKGEKDSLHTGWWEDGNKKYEYHFSNGNYNGLFTEWYQSGKMIQQVLYENGKEIFGKGWRENGKLYMSFVMRDGRRYGLFNANLCYSLVKEDIK